MLQHQRKSLFNSYHAIARNATAGIRNDQHMRRLSPVRLAVHTPHQQPVEAVTSHPYDFFMRPDDEPCLVDYSTATAGACWGSPSEVRQRLMQADPGLDQSLISSGTTISQLFNHEKWDIHRRSSRYLAHLVSIPTSTVFRRVLFPSTVVTAVAAAVCAYNTLAPACWLKLTMSAMPHTLLGAAISLQLVFRTNGAYARFIEGRAHWGRLIMAARDWTRIAAIHLPYAQSTRAAAYIQALAFCLKAKLRKAPPKAPDGCPADMELVVRQLLPAHEAEQVLNHPQRCYHLVVKMTALMKEASQHLPQYAALRMDDCLSAMLSVLGGCERILGTPIPLSYSRHTTRSLTLWLATLPLALWPAMHWLTVPAMFAMCFIFMGIDEIGVEIEEPFCILPLMPLCKTIMRDVCSAMEQAPAYQVQQA